MSERTNLLMGASPRTLFHAPASASLMLRGPQVAYNTDDGGALSIDQASEMILGAPLVEDSAPEPDDAPQAAGDDGADGDFAEGGETDPEDGAIDEDPVEGLDGGEDEAGAKEPVEALDAPAYWSKEAKARFAALDPELQAVVLSQEGPREEATAKAKAEAAQEVQAARSQSRQVQTLAEQLVTFLPEAIETFQQRWGEPDWEATIQQYGAQEAALLRARYDKEQGQLQQLAQQTQVARTQAHQAYMLDQFGVLATLDPVLAPDVKDPRKGSEKRQEVTKYLLDQGVAPEGVAQISAVEMTMARKAMLWDRAEAARKAPKSATRQGQQQPIQNRRPTPQPGSRPAGSAAASPQQQGRASVQNAFNSKPSVDNAVALLMARSKR